MPAELRTYFLRDTTDRGFVELPHAAALVAVKAQRRNAARRIRGARSSDARARRTQARLNLALERGELHMACWFLSQKGEAEWPEMKSSQPVEIHVHMVSPQLPKNRQRRRGFSPPKEINDSSYQCNEFRHEFPQKDVSTH